MYLEKFKEFNLIIYLNTIFLALTTMQMLLIFKQFYLSQQRLYYWIIPLHQNI